MQKIAIQTLTTQISRSFQHAYDTFKEALEIHDDWEKIYISNMDFKKADQLTTKLIGKFFGIIDMYELLISPGTDEIYADTLRNIAAQYKSKMEQATSYLARAKQLHDELETIYVAAMDFSKVEVIGRQIEEEINALASVQQK